MTKWVGNVMLALLSMLAGFAAFYARFLVQNFLGYTGADTFTSVYRTNNFLDLALLKGLTHFAQILLSNGHVEAVSDNVGQLAKFVVEVIFFGLIWSVRVRFSGEKRNVEP